MSFYFLLSAILLTALLILLSFFIRNIFIAEDTSIKGKAISKTFSSSRFLTILEFYRKNLQLRQQIISFKRFLLFSSHYISIHCMTPLWGLAFFLHTNGNFLVVILSIITSFQLHQRLSLSLHHR